MWAVLCKIGIQVRVRKWYVATGCVWRRNMTISFFICPNSLVICHQHIYISDITVLTKQNARITMMQLSCSLFWICFCCMWMLAYLFITMLCLVYIVFSGFLFVLRRSMDRRARGGDRGLWSWMPPATRNFTLHELVYSASWLVKFNRTIWACARFSCIVLGAWH